MIHGVVGVDGNDGDAARLKIPRQLHEAGEETLLLVLLDTPIAGGPSMTKAEKVQFHLQNLRAEGASYPVNWLRHKREYAEVKRQRDRDDAASLDPLARHDGGELDSGVLHSTEIESAFYRALEMYTTPRHHGVISLFRPKLVPAHVFGPDRWLSDVKRFLFHDNGWAPYCDRVDVFEVPGTHDTMVLEPNVRVLAARVRAEIESAERTAMSLGAR